MNDAYIWSVIIVLGVGTWLIRFSFIGIIGDRELPAIVTRLLRYVPVAVLPAIVAPLVVWPEATGGAPDVARVIAATAALAVGAWTRNVLGSIFAGMATLYLMLWLTS
jgi:branched-subunit amino acid transport protein